jgi:hypothetical protein
LPELCAEIRLEPEELTFSDYANLVSEWLRRQELRVGDGVERG